MAIFGKDKEKFKELEEQVVRLKKEISSLESKVKQKTGKIHQLQSWKKLYKNFNKTIGIPLVIFSPDLKVTFINDKAARFFNSRPSRLSGKNCHELFFPDSDEEYNTDKKFFSDVLLHSKEKLFPCGPKNKKVISILDYNRISGTQDKDHIDYILFKDLSSITGINELWEYRDGQNLKDGKFTLPVAPKSIPETGLNREFLADLVLKILYSYGELSGEKISKILCLPFKNIVENILSYLNKGDAYITSISVSKEKVGSPALYPYKLTQTGLARTKEIMERNKYVGPAPVPIEKYREIINSQKRLSHDVTTQDIQDSLSDLVLGQDLIRKLTIALTSKETVFLHGPPGNGKSTISKTCSNIYRDKVLIPHAIEVDSQIIKVFDPVYHKKIYKDNTGENELHKKGYIKESFSLFKKKNRQFDRRWNMCKSPLIVAGGELTLDDLELKYDPISKFYEAPLQIKANGGALVIDDFGRQKVSPEALLNRWMVPLEEKIDYVRMHTGKQVIIPLDQILLFSTNLKPENLGDEAFFRRLKNKIFVKDPTEEQFREIFQMACRDFDFKTSPQIEEYVIRKIKDAELNLRGYIPRDLLKNAAAISSIDAPKTEKTKPLKKEIIDEAFENCFL
ncbi:MAG: hypothetical protein ACQEQC_00325 [Elusimicrobiota bacterium]